MLSRGARVESAPFLNTLTNELILLDQMFQRLKLAQRVTLVQLVYLDPTSRDGQNDLHA